MEPLEIAVLSDLLNELREDIKLWNHDEALTYIRTLGAAYESGSLEMDASSSCCLPQSGPIHPDYLSMNPLVIQASFLRPQEAANDGLVSNGSRDFESGKRPQKENKKKK